MTNAVGGNIKVTLTLDDAGFSVKTRQNRDSMKGMNAEFGRAAKAIDGFETKLGTLGKNVTLTSNNLKTLQTSAKQLDAQFATMGRSMAGFNQSAAMASQNAELLNGAVLKLARLLDGAANETNKAASANTRLATSQREVASSTAATVNGLTAQQRAMKNLGTEHANMAQKVVLAAGLRKNENARQAADEINANNKLIANKKAALDSMMRAEREYQNTLNIERSKQMALQQRIESRRDTNGRMMGVNSPNLVAYQRELELQNQKVAGIQRGLTLISQEGMRMAQNLTIMGNQNRVLEGRIGVEGRIEAALQRQNQRALEYLSTQRRNADRAKELLETNRQQMEMVKGMSQLYAGMKIAQGEKAAVRSAGEFERTNVRAKSMGMSKEEQADFDYMVKHDSKTHPGLSFNDAATARIAAMGGLASTNQRQINQILPTAIDTAQNIQYITGDEGHESFENYIRNLTGVAEARQVQYNPAQTKTTMELMQKIMVATGNKIDIPDVETFLRRIGPGGASQISDDGIINSVALLDQMKVSGGAGGGGAGGVSTVGTMFKMMTAYATGKTMSNEMVRQAADAGILNTDAIGGGKKADGSDKAATPEDNSLKSIMTEAKKAGFKNSQLFNTDPVSAIRQMMATVLGTISSEANKQKYFGDSDVNDPEAQRAALSKWATRNGTTTTASQLLVTIADPRMQERVDHQSHMIKGSSSVEELKQLRMDTYEQQVKNFDAAMANLKVTLGATVLPMLTDFFNWMSKAIDKVTEFSTNNPMVAQMAMIGGAVAGVVLTLSGMARMFGIVGTLFGSTAGSTGLLAGAFRLLLSPLKLITIPLGLLWSGIVRLGAALAGPIIGAVTGLGARLMGLLGAGAAVRAMFAGMLAPIISFGASILGIGARFLGLGSLMGVAAKIIGGVFLRMIPFVGWLYTAWELGGLLLQFQVGFASIGEWIGHWMDGMLNTASIWATKFRNSFRISDESNEEGAANLKALEAEGAAADAAWEAMRAERQKKEKEEQDRKDAEQKKRDDDLKAKEAEAAKQQQDIQDMIDGKGFTHVPKTAEINPDSVPYVLPDAPAKKTPREPRTPRDQFARSLADVTSKQEVTAMQITAQITGRADNLLEQARTEFFQKWKAGDFDPDHDAKKRPFQAAGGGLDWKASGAAGSVDEWVTTRAAMLQQEEQLKGLTYANERIAAAREDANTAMERGTDDTAKQTREMAGLTRELARTEERLKNGTKEFEAWGAKKNQALFERSRADLVNYTADFTEGDRTTQDSMIYNSKERVGSQFDTKAQKDLETYNARLAEMTKNYNASRVSVQALGLSQEEMTAQLKTLDTEYNESRTRAETTFTEHVKIQANARQYAMRGAVEKMQQDWENAFDKMDEVTASWGNGFVSSLSTVLTGGAFEWRGFLAGMLKDVLDMKLKESLAKPMSELLDGMGTGLTGLLSAKKANPAAGAAGQAAGAAANNGMFSGIGDALSSAGGAIKSGVGSVASMFGLDKLAGASDAAKTAMTDMTTNGVNAATSGLITQVAQQGITVATETTAQGTTAGLILAFQALNAATIQLAASMAAAATSSTISSAFANGGIMSSAGSLPLKAYANGGVANSPQLALFGEGRMNEAYVPLPDGRSIPVSFSGTGAGAGDAGVAGVNAPVTISIVVHNDGGETEESSGTDDRQGAKELANKIKALVRESMITETRPGGILEKRK